MQDSLVMRVTYPWEGRDDRYAHDDVCDDPGDQDWIVIVLVVNENHNHAEYQPEEPRRRATRVYTTYVLKYGGASETEP